MIKSNKYVKYVETVRRKMHIVNELWINNKLSVHERRTTKKYMCRQKISHNYSIFLSNGNNGTGTFIKCLFTIVDALTLSSLSVCVCMCNVHS